jgi:hypothetical protein
MSSLHGSSHLAAGNGEHHTTHLGLNPKELQAQVKVKSPLAQRRGVSALHDISENSVDDLPHNDNASGAQPSVRPHFKKVSVLLRAHVELSLVGFT